MAVQGRAQEDEQVGLERERARRARLVPVAARRRLGRGGGDLAPAKDLARVRDGAGEPLCDAEAVVAEALGVVPHGALGALEAADKQDAAVALDDALDDLGRAPQGREGLAQVDVRDAGAGAVHEREGGAVRVGRRVTEVGPGGDEVRGRDGGRGGRAVQRVVRLEGRVAVLGRAELGEDVGCGHESCLESAQCSHTSWAGSQQSREKAPEGRGGEGG